MPREQATSPQAVTLPQGGADVRGLGGAFVPDHNRGTGSFSLDLVLPPGVAGFAPRLTLSYSSGGSNGVFGLGWSLNVPKFQRNGEARFLRYDDSDPILLDDSGELVRLADGSYRPKVDLDFARILRTATGGWQTQDREGRIQCFGTTADARIADPNTAAHVLAWALDEEEDLHGNRITYGYIRDANNLYLSEVRYAVYRLALVYEPRPDEYGTPRHGFPIETHLRCRRIEIHSERLEPATLIRSYTFDYHSPDEVPLSLLDRITFTGHRTCGGSTESASLPPLSLSYSALPPRPTLRTCTTDPLRRPPPLGVDGTELLDVTGDGLPDAVQLDGPLARYWRNRGDGSWDAPQRFSDAPSDVHLSTDLVTFADMNGDGGVDLLVDDGVHAGWYPKLPGGGWGRFHRYAAAPTPFGLHDPHTRQVDLNGDGVVDLLRTEPNRFVLYLNQGTTWSTAEVPRQSDVRVFPDVFFNDPHVHLADMTGDGLSDIVLVHSGAVWYWPYEGLGRWGKRRVMGSPPVFDHGTDPQRIFLSDLNGDGVADLVHVGSDTVTVWFNRLGARFADPTRIGHTPSPSGDVRVADLFGGGVNGVLWSNPPGRSKRASYTVLELCGEQKPYLLTGIDNGLGRRTHISYSTSTRFAAQDREQGRPWSTFLPFPVHVVNEIRQQEAVSGCETVTRMRYHDGMYDGRERRFAGFGQIDVEEVGDDSGPGLVTTTLYDSTDAGQVHGDARALALARQGRALETTQRESASGTLLRRAVNAWDARVATRDEDGGPVVVVHRTENSVTVYGGADGPLVKSRRFHFDESGNLIREEYQANGPSPLAQTSRMEYPSLPDGRVLSKPCRVVETRPEGTMLRELRTYYDGAPFAGLPLGTATRGNPSRQSVCVLSADDYAHHYRPQGYLPADLGYREEDGAVWSDVLRLAHDSRGCLIEARTALGAQTTVGYDPDGVFPVNHTDAGQHTSTFTWDDAALQPQQHTDPNAAITRFDFDPLGRVTAVALPGDTLEDPSETVAYAWEATPPKVDVRKRMDGGEKTHRRTFHTGTGEIFQSRTRVDATTVVISPLRTYNTRGWLASEGQARYGTDMEFVPAPTTGASRIGYDALGRITSVTYADGRHDRTVFEPFRTLHYDANDTDDTDATIARGFFDTPRIHRYDGWGRLTGVTEAHDGLLTSHNYSYDETGRLTAVCGPDGTRILGQTFDLAGNRLVLEHRDAGMRRFYWNASALPVRVVDGIGQVIDRDFDALERLTLVSANGVPAHTLAYDEPSRPAQQGRLSTVHDEAGSWEFNYDALGRVTRRTLREGGRQWQLDHAYTAAGAIALVRCPDGSEVQYEYDLAGRLRRIPGYVEEIQHDPEGRTIQVRCANGVRTLLDRVPENSFLQQARVLAPDDTPLEDFTYERDNVGNLLVLTDGRPPGPGGPQSRTFQLDGRYRLVRASGGASATGVPAYTRAYAYDQATNIVQHPAWPGSAIWYDPPGSNLIAGITTAGAATRLFRHDGNGNMVQLPNRTCTFDALGRLTCVKQSSGDEIRHRYDMTGNRVWTTTAIGGVTRRTLTLGGLYEEDDDGAVRRYIRAGHNVIVREDASGRVYLHANDLGHITLITDAAGDPVGRRIYHPFGEPAFLTGVDDPHGFGGHLLDEISGLYFAGARSYAPDIGRFISPDPMLLARPEVGIPNPQLHNLYAYCGNNPMVYADPHGLSLWGAVFGGLVGSLVGAAFFVGSGGNPVLAGVMGGYVGGTVAGGIDGGTRGAVIGGCLGAATGLIGGAAAWSVSSVGAYLGGEAGRTVATSALSTVAALTNAGAGVYQILAHGNPDLLVGTAAGFVGALIGSTIVNVAIMKSVYDNPNTSPYVRREASQVGELLGNNGRYDHIHYKVVDEPNSGWYARQTKGEITFNKGTMGYSYLTFRRVFAHELYHEYDSQVRFDFPTDHALYKELHEGSADWFAWRFTKSGTGEPGSLPYVFAPVVLSMSLPSGYETRNKGMSAAWE